MSTLFKATDLKDGKLVAIKIPHERWKPTRSWWSVSSARKPSAELDHPGVVKTYDGEDRSRSYMVIEWVDGGC